MSCDYEIHISNTITGEIINAINKPYFVGSRSQCLEWLVGAYILPLDIVEEMPDDCDFVVYQPFVGPIDL